jgi:hypothetical protein
MCTALQHAPVTQTQCLLPHRADTVGCELRMWQGCVQLRTVDAVILTPQSGLVGTIREGESGIWRMPYITLADGRVTLRNACVASPVRGLFCVARVRGVHLAGEARTVNMHDGSV